MTFLQEMEQNADEIRRLLGVPTAGEVALQFTAMSVSLARELVSLTQSIALSLTPVGAIIAWHKNAATNFPPLPANWLECNGQTVNDPTSPFHGLTLSDLNTTNLFLRGAPASGGAGGSTSHNHGYNATTDVTAGADTSVVHPSSTTTTENHLPPYFEVVWVIRIK